MYHSILLIQEASYLPLSKDMKQLEELLVSPLRIFLVAFGDADKLGHGNGVELAEDLSKRQQLSKYFGSGMFPSNGGR